LPETVESFLITTEQRARALVNTGTALLIACAEAEIADWIANHEHMKKLCPRAGERHLVVPVEAEEPFRKALRSLGYGMPRVGEEWVKTSYILRSPDGLEREAWAKPGALRTFAPG